MARKVWMHDPDGGGVKIPERTEQDVRRRLEAFAVERYAGRYTRLAIRFHGQFCYVDAFTEPDHVGPPSGGETREEKLERLRSTPRHLCRPRHFSADRWTLGFYKYSNGKYELCLVEEAGGFECAVAGGVRRGR